MRKKITLLSLLFVPSFLMAGTVRQFRHLMQQDGLPSNTVYACHQDRLGAIWFGTLEGLAMYDTYAIRVFRPEDTDGAGSLCVNCIQEDTDGKLWLGAHNGLYTFDKESEVFVHILDSVRVRSVAIDPDREEVWAATLGDGLYCYALPNGMVRHYSIGKDYVPAVLRTGRGDIWAVASDRYLYHFDAGQDQFVAEDVMDAAGNRPDRIFSLCPDYSGGIWLSGWNSGIFHLDVENGRTRSFRPSWEKKPLKGRIHTVKEVEPGHLLFGCDDGLFALSEDGSTHLLGRRGGNDGSLSDNFVYDILQDREGGLWVGTYFGGVNYSGPDTEGFSFHTCYGSDFRGRIVSRFCEDPDGHIWVGTDDGGLFLYDPQTGESAPVMVDPSERFLNIHALLLDEENLWIGTYSDGLYRMDTRSRQSERVGDFSSVYSLFKDRTGHLWVGTKESVYRSEKTSFRKVYDGGFGSDFINIESDREDNLWIASIRHGLLKYNPQTDSVEETGRQNGFPLNLSALCVYGQTILFGVPGQGIYSFDTVSGICRPLESVNRDLSGLSVSGLLPADEEIWIACNEGLLRFNFASGRAVAYGADEGINNLYFNTNAILKASDGRLYFGVNGGFNAVRPDALKKNLTVPGVLVMPMTATLRTGRPLTFRFSALSYRSPQNNQYRFRLEGYEEAFHETSSREHTVTYEHLPRGSYVFSVAASNNDSIWSDSVQIPVKIVPPWWASFAAIIGYVILCFGLLLLSIRMLRKYYRQLEEVRNERKRLERAELMARELKTPVMLISAPANEILSMSLLPDKVRENMQLIKRGSDMLYRLSTEVSNSKTEDEHEHAERPTPEQMFPGILAHFLKDASDHSEDHFLEQIGDIIWQNLSNEDFSVDDLAGQMHLSRSVLFQRVKGVTGKTPNNFIKMIRLQAAAEYIAQGKYRINEICYMVGFGSPSYFSKCFKDKFGVLPKDY